jgi:hypothetical protein
MDACPGRGNSGSCNAAMIARNGRRPKRHWPTLAGVKDQPRRLFRHRLYRLLCAKDPQGQARGGSPWVTAVVQTMTLQVAVCLSEGARERADRR